MNQPMLLNIAWIGGGLAHTLSTVATIFHYGFASTMNTVQGGHFWDLSRHWPGVTRASEPAVSFSAALSFCAIHFFAI